MVYYLKGSKLLTDAERNQNMLKQSYTTQKRLEQQDVYNFRFQKYSARTGTSNQKRQVNQQQDGKIDHILQLGVRPQPTIIPINFNLGTFKLGLFNNLSTIIPTNTKKVDKQFSQPKQYQFNILKIQDQFEEVGQLVAHGFNPRRSSQGQRQVQRGQLQMLVQNRKNIIHSKRTPSSIQKQTFYNQTDSLNYNQQMERISSHQELVQSIEVLNKLPFVQTITEEQFSPILIRESKKAQYYNETIKEDQFYTYYVGGGNNGELVKRIMQTRQHWKPTNIINSIFNFKWLQSSQFIKFDRLNGLSGSPQIVNHFPNHKDISDKSNLIYNLKLYSETKKLQLWDITPLTFIVDLADQDAELQLSKFASFFLKHLPKSKKPENHKKVQAEFRRKIKPLLINQNQDKFQKNQNPFSKPRMHPSLESGDYYIWLLKPSDFNRGRGIQLFDNLETLEKLLFELKDGMAEYNIQDKEDEKLSPSPQAVKYIIKSQEFVIQKYVQRPLLIKGRKFDIRVWVLITHQLNCYFFKEGYLRTSCEQFQMDNIENAFIHLTNNAVQQQCSTYGQFEDGNQLSFEQFDQFLKSQGHGDAFNEKMIPAMKSHISSSLLSVKKNFNIKEYKHCFEIFGYDFIVDDLLNMWLIEVNTNPCIEESSPLLKMIIPRMINDAFKLTIDQILPKQKHQQLFSSTHTHETYKKETFNVTNYGNENMFEFLLPLYSPLQKKLEKR